MAGLDDFRAIEDELTLVQGSLLNLDAVARAANYALDDATTQRVNEVRGHLIRLDAALHRYVTGR